MRKLKLKIGLLLTAIVVAAVVCSSCSKSALSPKERYTISLDQDMVHFYQEGGVITITVSTNSSWQVHTSSDWVSFVPTQAGDAGDEQTIVIAADPFDTDNGLRTAIISVKCGDLTTDAVVRKFITITQDGPFVEARDPGIYNVNDLVAFGNAIASATTAADPDYSKWADENGVINLMNDISSATPLPCMGAQTTANDKSGAFGGVFDGHGYAISGTLASGADKPIVALFTRLAATGIIKNLTVDVTAANTYTVPGTNPVQQHLAAIVGFSVTATTGYIENCVSKGTLTLEGTLANPRVAGIVAYGRCNITGCTNEANITATSNRVAGINGAGGGAFTIKSCINKGNITADCTGAQVGGIIGQLNGQTVIGCTNNGIIRATAHGATVVGGIAGNSQGAAAIGSSAFPCVNNGAVAITTLGAVAPTTACGAGGISGGLSVATAPFAYCTNNADVSSSVDNANIAVGGIIGTVSGASTISNCVNAATATISSAQNAGGIVGRSTAAGAITSCSNAGAITRMAGATVPASYFGGIAGLANTATLTTCTYGGMVLGAPGDATNAKGTVAP